MLLYRKIIIKMKKRSGFCKENIFMKNDKMRMRAIELILHATNHGH